MWGYVATFATGCAFTTAVSALGRAVHGGLTLPEHIAPFTIMAALAAFGFWAETTKR